MIPFNKQTTCSDHFADAGKMIGDGEGAVPKMMMDENDAGNLLGDKKQN